MSENQMGKYFKYAIGEILLVVIGILIALQINNWNEEQKLKKEEQNLISDLIVEIENNLVKIDYIITLNDSIHNKTTHILKGVLDNTISLKASEIPELFNYNPNNTQSPILENIIGSDSRALISNKKYLQQMRKLDYSYKAIEKIEFYMDQLWNNRVSQFLMDTGVGVHMRFDDLAAANDIEFNADQSFISLLSMMNSFQNAWSNRLKKTQLIMNETLQMLEKQ